MRSKRKVFLFSPLKWAIFYLIFSLLSNYVQREFFSEYYRYARLIVCFIFLLAIVSFIRFLFRFIFIILFDEGISEEEELRDQIIHEMPLGIFSIVAPEDGSSRETKGSSREKKTKSDLSLLRLCDRLKRNRDFLSFEVPTGDYETSLYYNNDGSVGILYFTNDRRWRNYEPFLSMEMPKAPMEMKRIWTSGELTVDSGEIFFLSDHSLKFDFQVEQDFVELPHNFSIEIMEEQKESGSYENVKSEIMRIRPFFGDGVYFFKIFREWETGACFFALELMDGSFTEIRSILNSPLIGAIDYHQERLRQELCPELRTIYDEELERGNSICRVDRSWEKMDLVIRFREPLALEKYSDPLKSGNESGELKTALPGELKTALPDDLKTALPGDLKIFETTDPHYEKGREIFSASARQSLSGPVSATSSQVSQTEIKK